MAEFEIRELAEKVEAVTSCRLSVDNFEDWFLSKFWGFYDTEDSEQVAVIAAVHHILFAHEANELREDEVAKELKAAIRLFLT